MKSKTRFVWRIVIFTTLLIGFLTGAFISGVMLHLEGVTVERIGLLVLSLTFSSISLFKIILANRNEVKSRVDSVVKGQHEFITEWMIPSDLWHKYLNGKLAYDIKESTGYGYIFGGTLTAILVFSLSVSFPIEELLMIALGVFVGTFGLTKLIIILVAKGKFKKNSEFNHAEIHFAKEMIILNGKLISLSDFGLRVKSVLIESKFDLELISIVTEAGVGNRKNRYEHHIPIPQDKGEEANRLLTYYAGLIN